VPIQRYLLISSAVSIVVLEKAWKMSKVRGVSRGRRSTADVGLRRIVFLQMIISFDFIYGYSYLLIGLLVDNVAVVKFDRRQLDMARTTRVAEHVALATCRPWALVLVMTQVAAV